MQDNTINCTFLARVNEYTRVPMVDVFGGLLGMHLHAVGLVVIISIALRFQWNFTPKVCPPFEGVTGNNSFTPIGLDIC